LRATDYFIKKRYSITGLEIGERQVEFLSKKYAHYPNFHPVCTQFEEYENTNDKYKLIFSATAFHWIKAEIGYPKVYRLLQEGGTVAVFWHMSPITKHETEMFSEIRNIYYKYAPELETSKNIEQIEQIHNMRLSQVQTNNLFGVPYYKNYSWVDEYTTERYTKLLNTFSSFQVLDTDKRKLVLDAVTDYISSKNGLIQVPQEVRLYMAKK
jgi:SAM-dependent methyltransferase